MRTRHWDRLGNGGLTFTEIGMGTAPLGNLYRAISDEEADAVLAAAWEGGVRAYDTAPLYGLGLAETRLNRFLRDRPRDDYVLTTKVGRLLEAVPPDERDGIGKWFDVPSRREVYDYSHDGIMRSVEHSLERLGAHRVDVLLAHDLDARNQGDALQGNLEALMAGGYRALVSLRDQGVIRAFGAGMNEWEPCEWLAERGDFDLFLLAGRYTLLEQTALDSFLPMTEARGIGVVIGGAYNSGILATGPRDGAWYDYEPAPPEILDRVGRIEAVCREHDTRLIDAAFRFPLLHPSVVCNVPGGQGREEMTSNLRAAAAEIPTELWAALKREGLMREDAPTP